MTKIVTSYGVFGIKMYISNMILYIQPLPPIIVFSDALFILYDKYNNEIDRCVYQKGNTTIISMSRVKDGVYYISLYIRNNPKANIYYPYINSGDVPILKNSTSLNFIRSIFLSDNQKFLEDIQRNIKYEKTLLATTNIQSTNLNICNLAKQIADGKSQKMDIIRAIHTWVALNISYDYDSLVNNIHVNKDNTALGAYVGRRCVCRGYTNLTIALLRALNIPAIEIFCYTTQNILEEKGNLTKYSIHHVFPAAWNGTRWILMDTTWDSKNAFEGGRFHDERNIKCPYKYFDVTIEFMSCTHKFLTYGPQ